MWGGNTQDGQRCLVSDHFLLKFGLYFFIIVGYQCKETKTSECPVNPNVTKVKVNSSEVEPLLRHKYLLVFTIWDLYMY